MSTGNSEWQKEVESEKDCLDAFLQWLSLILQREPLFTFFLPPLLACGIFNSPPGIDLGLLVDSVGLLTTDCQESLCLKYFFITFIHFLAARHVQ